MALLPAKEGSHTFKKEKQVIKVPMKKLLSLYLRKDYILNLEPQKTFMFLVIFKFYFQLLQ